MNERFWRVAGAIFGTPLSAFACPFCDGDGGRNPVKEALFTEHFGYFGLATLLPLAVSISIAYLLSANRTGEQEPHETEC